MKLYISSTFLKIGPVEIRDIEIKEIIRILRWINEVRETLDWHCPTANA